ncbi:hypothetical protein K1T71_003069 [Dendrolimus kikuchii]|uniref:Uncharacterized protein n=1 Tax=Dendrolimus kikuchii TaxID=765133 RepID=A0ACC1DB45_9NEOP|nr:hypothetical protein K1T71_003069 [Dendrolimus kikuchii]
MDDPSQGVAMNVEVADNEASEFQASSIKAEMIEETVITESMSETELSPKKSLQQTLYLPLTETCTGHSDLLLLEDEKLVKPGDKFESLVHFVQYLNENAKRWLYYYKCSDSRKPSVGIETYTYNCVYLKNKDTYIKKGLRKRNNNTKTDCPCKIKVRHLPNEKALSVVYVCNHHDHELTQEGFHKLQHGRRLPPYLKEEIMDFIALQVDLKKIKKYVHYVTGFTMSRPFFYTILRRMKNNNLERHITDKRLKELSDKLSTVENIKFVSDNNLNSEDQDSENMDETMYNSEEDGSPQHGKKRIAKYKRRSIDSFETEMEVKKIKADPDRKKTKANSDGKKITDLDINKIKIEDNIQEIPEDETMESVANLQQSIKCETQTNPWVSDQCVPNSNITVGYDTTDSNRVVQFKIIQDPNNTNEDGENIQYLIQYSEDDNGYTVQQQDGNNTTGYVLNEQSGMIEHNNLFILNESTGEIEYNNFIINENDAEIEQNQRYILNESNGEIELCQDNSNNENYITYETVVNEFVSDGHAIGDDSQLGDQTDAVYETDNADYEEKPKITGKSLPSLDYDENISQINQCQNNKSYNTTEFEDSTLNNESTMTSEYETQNMSDFNDSTLNNQSTIDAINKETEEAVKAFEKANPGHSLMPVFDVVMKNDGNVAYIVNENALHELKGTDKEVQTDNGGLSSDNKKIAEGQNANIEIRSNNDCTLRLSSSTYTKDEYIHKYNIDIYMTQPNFPKYIEILANEISIDILEMFTNIYKEKAMFKMTTTQTGKHGNTKIWYIKDKHTVRKIARRTDTHHMLDETFILKEKNRALKKRNEALVMKNKYLQDILSKFIQSSTRKINLKEVDNSMMVEGLDSHDTSDF